MSKKVWVIEQGEYSDYQVVGVFSSRENAERIAEKINRGSYSYDKAEVAEWEMDPGVEALNDGLLRWSVTMLRDGTVEHITGSDEWGGYDLDDSVWLWKRTEAPAYRGKGVPDALRADLWAKDEKHAVKIANEKRTQMIASGEWD